MSEHADTADAEPQGAPDPADLDPITEDEAKYQRDDEGDLPAKAYAIMTSDGWRPVEIYPITKGEQIEYEERFAGRDDLDVEEFDDILNEKVADPDLDWSDPDLKPDIYMPIVKKVREVITSQAPSNQSHAEVRDELAARESQGQGN
jgi:hypothetical protein